MSSATRYSRSVPAPTPGRGPTRAAQRGPVARPYCAGPFRHGSPPPKLANPIMRPMRFHVARHRLSPSRRILEGRPRRRIARRSVGDRPATRKPAIDFRPPSRLARSASTRSRCSTVHTRGPVDQPHCGSPACAWHSSPVGAIDQRAPCGPASAAVTRSSVKSPTSAPTPGATDTTFPMGAARDSSAGAQPAPSTCASTPTRSVSVVRLSAAPASVAKESARSAAPAATCLKPTWRSARRPRRAPR